MGVVTSFPVEDKFPLARNRAGWMGSLVKKEPFNFGSLKLHEIVIPGTHNSATYYVEPNLGSAIAKCQKDDIETQLESGIRFFDFRICDDTPSNVLRISHRFLCGTLGEIFHQIYCFLRENESEVLVVAIKKDWDRELSEQGINKLCDMIENYFSEFIMGDHDAKRYGIKELIEKNKRILFISENLESTRIPVTNMKQSWCDTNSVSSRKLLGKLYSYIHKVDHIRQIRVHDCYITPSAESITRWCVKGINWHKLQKDNNHKVLAWLKESCQGYHDFNVISLDMISQDFVDYIIQLNPRKLS